MSESTEKNELKDKYNLLYERESIDALSAAEKEALHVQPISVEGWPAGRKQALVHLAKPTTRSSTPYCV